MLDEELCEEMSEKFLKEFPFILFLRGMSQFNLDKLKDLICRDSTMIKSQIVSFALLATNIDKRVLGQTRKNLSMKIKSTLSGQ